MEDCPAQNHYTDGQRSSLVMPTRKQRTAARRNIKKAAAATKRKRTVAHLPTRVRTALGKEGAKAAEKNAAKIATKQNCRATASVATIRLQARRSGAPALN
jgi:hypothetical protein